MCTFPTLYISNSLLAVTFLLIHIFSPQPVLQSESESLWLGWTLENEPDLHTLVSTAAVKSSSGS